MARSLRINLATRVFFASLLLGGMLLIIFSLIEAPWRVQGSPVSHPWWYLVILVASVVSAFLAAMCAVRLRRFFLFTQQLVFGALFSASMLLLLLLAALITSFIQCSVGSGCAGGYWREIWMAVVWTSYAFAVLVLLPSLLFGISALGVAKWSLRGRRANRVFWLTAAVVAVSVGTFALLTQAGVFPEPRGDYTKTERPALALQGAATDDTPRTR